MITTDNITYKDDFLDSNVDGKNYLRILFNGGRSVQIRELNQVQSILQNQIDKFGSSIYKEGAAVLGGGVIFDKKIYAIQFSTISLSGINIATAIRLTQDDIVANIIGYDSDDTNTTFYIRYVTSGVNESDTVNITNLNFDTGANITITFLNIANNEESNPFPTNADEVVVAGAFLDDGVFYTNGCFVVTPKQQIFIPITNEIDGINGKIVLSVTEDFITYLDDSSLLDNASGTPNHLAPGADRYQITLTLGFVDAESEVNDDQISLIDIVNSKIIISSKSKYRELENILATRTHEESGDYILNPFKIDIEELLNSHRPGSTALDAADKFYLGVDPSVAYVDGYRIELSNKLDMVGEKARDTLSRDTDLSVDIGSYFVGTFDATSQIPIVNRFDLQYNLKNVGNVTIGTCRIRAVESGRLFVYDIVLNNNVNISDVDHVLGNDVRFDIEDFTTLQDASIVSSVFKLPVNTVEGIDADNFSYVVQRHITLTGSGPATFALGSNEIFATSDRAAYTIEEAGLYITDGTVSISPDSKTLTVAGVSGTIKVIAPIRVTIAPSATKTITTITDEARSVYANNIIELSNTDIIELDQVLNAAGDVDITADFVLNDDGQRSNYYTNGSIRYIGNGSIPTNIKVSYKHYAHSGLPFTVNSYSTTAYDAIPKFEGYSLADCLDFRPTLLSGATNITNVQIDPYSIASCTPSYYLSRIDKLVVTANAEFKLVSGTPSTEPIVPPTPPSSLSLYELYIPAYTFNASDIEITFVDNRRYTMRDIGKLDKRINNLEYYTSLSLLEKSASEREITDAEGNRFKNGILVDAFTGHGVGNVFDPAYACSIDTDEGVLRPMFTTNGIDLVHTSSNSNISINANTATLTFTETPLIQQNFSSESMSVNPYDVASFVGNISLYPSTDKWMETNRRPAILVNETGAYDALKFMADENGILGTDWNSWQTKWTGISGTVRSKKHSVLAPDGKLRRQVNSTLTSLQEQSGVVKTLSSKITQERSNRIIDLSFIPFMRSRRVYFEGKGLKPRTRVYPFFDGISIDDYCKAETLVDFTAGLDAQRDAISSVVTNHIDETSLLGNGPLITNANGNIKGSFIVPNNSLLKFRTGERALKLTDSSTNNSEEETTFAEGIYSASGHVETTQATIVSTRVPVIDRARVVGRRTTTDTVTRYVDPLAQTFLINDIQEGVFLTSIDLWFTAKSTTGIPVTVRIVEVDNGYPTQRIIPFSEVTINPSDVIATWDDDVSADVNNTRVTKFTFGDPVYLKSGVEYAFVILSNDPAYRVRVARLGGKDENQNIIQTNPYGGVMFSSQNASTWTPDQTRDIRFNINRAEFVTNTNGIVTFRSVLDSDTVAIDPSSAFTFMQAASVQKECELVNALLFDTNTYDNIEPAETYSPLVPLDITTARHANLRSTISTSSKYVSPIIDLDGISLISIHNKINDSVVDEEFDATGEALARYITREVELNDPADQLNIYLDVNRPKSATNLTVYVKTKTDSVTYTDWVLVQPTNPLTINGDDYSEAAYVMLTPENDFIGFAIKIVFTSPSTIDTCKVKNLRAIATT